ncbi:Phage SPO1 DNA polymerase-related protein [Syntrophobacter sp. SbD1]|nr:Phage SPO1 DNA polymerase-related protein [Syntrophobacter sp. SbD1]
MTSYDTSNELAACLERLRWVLWGYRAAGISDLPASRRGLDARLQNRRAQKEESPSSVLSPESSPQSSVLSSVLSDLSRISSELTGCTRCRLHSGRTNLVFGEGSAESRLVFIGEGPGFEEDRQGRPFVGRAGKLLDKMILAIGFAREDVYICNIVKCRPPENRTPLPDEAAVCSPFLFRQIQALSPKVICALGLSAAQTLLGSTRPISQLRGKVQLWRGIPLICTYHPAYLLRSPSQKAAAWQDLKEVIKLL